ncbi:MAG: YkoF family thiamine/hydroxymethylpyrimidine-binding protein [Bacillota bacterium]
MENSKIISCQISFYPLNTKKVNEEVKKVIKIISESELDYESNAVSTIIYGKTNKVYSLLEKITSKMNDDNSEFSMSINISNSCGCDI